MLKIYHYLQGYLRYYLFYSKEVFGINLSGLIRKHILKQINLRITSMDRQCFEQGSCKKCGCKTTALQMADKPCPGDCYPPMMSRTQWENFNKINLFVELSDFKYKRWKVEHNKFILF